MKKKVLVVVLLVVVLLGLGVGVGIFLSQDSSVSFDQICPAESAPLFIKANISRRQGEQGEVKELFEVTSEDREDLLKKLPAVLSQYRYKSDSHASVANDFISLSFAYSDSVVYRFDVYADSTLVMLASTDAGIWKIQATGLAQEGLYLDLYHILITI